MTDALRALLVEDRPSDAKLLLIELRKRYPALEHQVVDTEAQLRQALGATWDIAITDWNLPGMDAMRVLAVAKELAPDMPVVVVSGTIGEESAAEAMRAGASDFVVKSRLTRLNPVVEREVRDHRQRVSHRYTEEALERAEAQLRQAQKMEAIGNLAGGIAHDFNNLLSVVLSYASIIAAQVKPNDSLQEDIRQLERAAQRGAELTKRLLAFSRRQVLQPRLTRLDEVVRQMEPMLRRLIGEDIALTVLASNPVGHALLDPGQIEQVVMNLVINARDAMPRGGKLTIEASNIHLDASYAEAHIGVKVGAHVMLTVTDTGTGMDKETQSHVFEPFFTTKSNDKGTGLGLATVFGIVQQSGGNIWVYSEPGHGTTFKIYFPRADAVVVSARRSSSSSLLAVNPQLHGTETILLVEDDDQVRAVVTAVLRRAGYSVLEASNAGEALLICEQQRETLDAMITDVVMPRMNGPQLAERLRQVRPQLRVLFTSGYPGHAIVEQGGLPPEAHFVSKPFTPGTLLPALRALLDGAPT